MQTFPTQNLVHPYGYSVNTRFSSSQWLIAWSDEFVKNIQNIDRKLQGRILEAISHISAQPTVSTGDTVKPLKGELKGLWRYRIGKYRLVSHIPHFKM
ncbi:MULTISPECIES: type II toxin-antitoxin system RelE family toxin [unclassified Coleofasciculus]|uniref:type II toxin-antitoxin system RelE family toxin n=1 Tax=unclassified Coleofasciculus TaxID=2692782 RepID=UPI00187F0D03|nr:MULTISPECIES: type II toxin-antitoxin system RelE/ParE family toxin [unclassified Coleofasciculus]MBE9127810.1 hypothetical protein [Coleofasciculus sp. LEGE 07081]MBE9149437.1 hypothetical protein [Coleofasciculus sp. LEGE 07092]